MPSASAPLTLTHRQAYAHLIKRVTYCMVTLAQTRNLIGLKAGGGHSIQQRTRSPPLCGYLDSIGPPGLGVARNDQLVLTGEQINQIDGNVRI